MARFLRNALANLYRWTLLALAETAVATPWVIVLYRLADDTVWSRALPGAWLLIGTYLAAALWEAGRPSGPREVRSRLAGMGVGSIAAYLLAYFALPDDLRHGVLSPNIAIAVLPVAWYLWYQATESVALGIEYGRLFGRFTQQAIAMVLGMVLVLLAGLAREPRLQVMLYWDVFMLFGSGLTLLLIARERALKAGQRAMGEAGAGEAFSRKLTVLVALMLGLTLVASQVLSPAQLAGWLAAAGRVVRGPFDWLVSIVLLIVVRWAALVFYLFRFLRGFFPTRPQGPAPEAMGNLPVQPLPEQILREVQRPDLMPYLKGAALIIMAVIIVVWMARLQRRRREAMGEPADEQRVSLGFWAGLLADLRLLLASLRRKPVVTAEAESAAVTGATFDPSDPRALFRRLQAWGVRVGRGRRAGETPSQYGRALAEQFPGEAGGAVGVAEVYNQARYGAQAPDASAVTSAAKRVADLIER